MPEDARRLFDAACISAELDRDPLPEHLEPRGSAVALGLGREWRIPGMEARLVPAIDARFEPTWDPERGEFTWGLGLGEEYPRGQYNAFLAAAEASAPGLWTRLSEAPLAPCPQVVGIDFPRVALTRARWREGVLELTLDVHREEPGVDTRFEVHGVEDRHWEIRGDVSARVEQYGEGLVVTTPMRSVDLELRPGVG